MSKKMLTLWLLLLLLIPTTGIMAQEEMVDTDGDSVPDEFDSCPAEAGLPQNSGCAAGVLADKDADGVADQQDVCFDQPGTAALLGCPEGGLPDFDADQDGVLDVLDACYDRPGDVANSGCPPDVVPDFDGDGVPDPEDACLQIPGDAANGGCINDPDGDFLASEYDGCPDQPGTAINYGCPEGTTPPDSDGDNVPDLADSCPQESGVEMVNGCPDADGDSVPDSFDECPQEAGLGELNGCVQVTEATLPASRAPITPANAASLTELAQLRIGAYQASLNNPDNQFALQTSSGVLLYDVSNPTLTPRILESTGGITAYSPTAGIAALVNYNMVDAGTGPVVEIWDANNATMMVTITMETPVLNTVALSPDGTVLATAHGTYYTVEGTEMPDSVVRLWNTADGSILGTLQHTEPVYKLMFSPDGTRLVTQTDTTMNVWDVAAQSQLGTLAGSFTPVFLGDTVKFSPDGARLATSGADGSVILWDVATLTEAGRLPIFTEGGDQMIASLAFSPDGSLLAVGVGQPFNSEVAPEAGYPVLLVNAADGTQVASLPGHGIMVMSIGFSADGTLLTTISGDSYVRFWGVAQ